MREEAASLITVGDGNAFCPSNIVHTTSGTALAAHPTAGGRFPGNCPTKTWETGIGKRCRRRVPQRGDCCSIGHRSHASEHPRLSVANPPDKLRAKRDRPSTSTTRAPSNTASTHTMKASAIRRPERWLAAWWRSAGNGDIDSHRPWRCSPSPLVAGQVEGARQNVGIERHSLAVCTRTSPLIAARCEQRED